MNAREAATALLRHARQEVAFVLIVWTLALLWVLGYCFLFGYQHEPQSWPVRWGLIQAGATPQVAPILGMPGWVCVGIGVPWLICSLVTIVFCFFMKDDELGECVEEAEGS